MHALQVTEIEAARERLLELKRQVSRVYIGEASAVDLLTVALLSRGHVLLEGRWNDPSSTRTGGVPGRWWARRGW
jgi:hypothetical protein